MNKKLVSFVKYNKFFLTLYRVIGNLFVKCLMLFVRVRKNRILFVSFGGQKYDDSPKALYEKMKEDPYFKEFEFFWAFTNPDKYDVPGAKKVKMDTLGYYGAVLSSKVWITNSSVERGLHLKRRGNIEINTWHGTPLKKMGKDIHKNQSLVIEKKEKGMTVYCSQSDYDQEIFSRLFNTKKENILISDLPRNDNLLLYSDEEKQQIREKLGISNDKKVLLYAPTFREFDRDERNGCYIAPPIDFKKWARLLGNEYVLLFRAHYEVIKVMGIENCGFMRDVSQYPYLNDLIAISDVLISDYSSIYFDYAITEKPMLNFSYDLKNYQEIRGLYLDIEKDLHCKINSNEDELISEIQEMNAMDYTQKTKQFKNRFAPYAGNSCNIVIKKLKDCLEEYK